MGLFSGFEHIVREQEPLAPYTWLRVGGPAQYFAEPTSVDELVDLVKHCAENEVHVRVLGSGSSLLVREAGVSGLVVHLAAAAFSQISAEGNTVTAGGGAKLSHVISTAVREGLAGLEPLAGVPGTVGGALHDNADANGTDIGQWTSKATMLTRTGAIVEQQGDQLRFAYRDSSLDELAILSAEFTLEKADAEVLTKRMQKFWIVKQSSQPTANENPACAFKDVGGMNAATLIEQAGCKGAAVGSAAVSQRDSRFIVANPGATSDDVLKLIEKIQAAVHEQLGVELETQVRIW
ncbi:MAG: UDP-N-acetylmuramate dehydrogenase [Planctomycetaceae bacterium]|nr:UDP-N-acetylmuramate dehydrogenase [Planctomycetales bacterium]MCB9925253.1 UDP-N-acetylmuramate dehydrogenase [Planctomycetaceae bacterium]